jgi:hypothetical protein
MTRVERCPACGAPTAIDPDGLCTHCHGSIPVMTVGWLLTAVRSEKPPLGASGYPGPTQSHEVPAEVLNKLPADVVAQFLANRGQAPGTQPPGT